MREYINIVETSALWTREEQNSLLADFDQDMTLSDLANKYHRTEAAIATRLIRLNRLIFIHGSGSYHKIDPEPWV